MDAKRFWMLVDKSRSMAGRDADGPSQAGQVRSLESLLRELGAQEIVSFREHFFARSIDLFRFDLWGVAYLLNDGCSDDGFMDFRNGIISMGQRFFDVAFHDPDSLCSLMEEKRVRVGDLFFEEFGYVPQQVYKSMTGGTIPDSELQHPEEPVGEPWAEDELDRRLPKTWAYVQRIT